MNETDRSFNSATYALSHIRHDLFRSITTVVTISLTIAFILLTTSLLFGLVNEISETDEKASILDGMIPGSVSMFEEFRIDGSQLSKESKASLVNYLLVTSVLVIMVAFFIMFNTMSISVQERRGEIGVLRSVGFSSREVMKIFLTEGGVIGMISFLSALFLGTPFIVNLAAYLIERGDGGIFFVQPMIPLQLVAIIGALTMLLTVFTTYLAAKKTLRVRPVEMLRPTR
ncbi:MAG: FtsX-like permease family protein [Candidatus Thermoplasmatota archaeon]|nr:FtsX-like permease family protein [Candidatus Thermoplasmatota archaeon]